MRDWFPLTNYEFYAFVSSGMVLIATVDYCFAEGLLVSRTEWTVVQIIFWTVVSYVIGQITASASSGIIEHLIARKFFRAPVEIAVGISSMRIREKIVSSLFAKREYSVLPENIRKKIIEAAAKQLSEDQKNISAETLFDVAFPIARSNADTVTRLENFINQYGFCRNMCFVAIIAFFCLFYKYNIDSRPNTYWLGVSAFIVAIGMYGRFIKYYASYSRDVLRTYYHHQVHSS